MNTFNNLIDQYNDLNDSILHYPVDSEEYAFLEAEIKRVGDLMDYEVSQGEQV